MKTFTSQLVLALATINSLTSAASLPVSKRGSYGQTPKPAAFYLAGDSTTCALSSAGGGWGVGFLSTLGNGAIGTDLGYNGATTVSYVAGGDWANVIDAVTRASVYYTPYVTIQFGHNDQKAAANITIAEYSANLAALANEAIAAGGFPILVTPITRRTFSGGSVIQDLAPQRNATIAVALSLNVAYIDLNEASTNYVNAIGAADAALYNRIPTDFTHLNAHGSLLFGTLVSHLMTTTTKYGQDIAQYSFVNKTIVAAIESGTFIYPSL